MTWPLELLISSVVPSGSARAASREPSVLPAPLRLSTKKFAPSRADRSAATSRVITSTVPPATVGTMIFTGRLG
jgi:hypothetical protein